MAIKTKFAVEYAGRVARFSDYPDAMYFARDCSAMVHGLVEVSDKTGLIGQFFDGDTTREFEAHWDAARGMP